MESIKILVDGEIKFKWSQERPEWDVNVEGQLWLDRHRIRGTFGEEGTFEVVIEEEKEDYREKRLAEYIKLQDQAMEAIIEKLSGRDEKWVEYVAKREEIKTDIPATAEIAVGEEIK